MTTGIESRVPFADYVAMDGINISRLKELGRSPLHYRSAVVKESAPLTLGRAAHCAVLEPERFERDWAVWTRRSERTGNLCPRNGQYWEAFQQDAGGREIINEDELGEVLAIQRAVRGDPAAMRYLGRGDPEVTMQWVLRNRPCKGRVDWLTSIEGEPYLIGLKTARDCRSFMFGGQAAKLGYHLQWAFYNDGYIAITGRKPKLREIVVESAPPHAVAVYRITEDVVLQGQDEYLDLLDLLETCERADEWPGPGNGEEQDISLPSWVYEKHDDLAELELEE